MKRILSVVALSAALASGMAVAGTPGGVWTGKAIVGGDGSTTAGILGTCILTSQDTAVGLSKGVSAGYQCFELANMILVAACHEGGNRTTPVTCTQFDHDNDPTTDPLIIGEGCTLDMALTGAKATAPSYMAFGGSSAGGAMNEIPLGGRCTNADSLTALTYWQ